VNSLESELMEEIARLVGRAEEVFTTHSELRDWIACVLHRRLHGVSGRPGGRCNEVAAAACAISFKGDCPLASKPSELDDVMNRLPTARLEALLRLECGAKIIT
jgi:hypothetical protein